MSKLRPCPSCGNPISAVAAGNCPQCGARYFKPQGNTLAILLAFAGVLWGLVFCSSQAPQPTNRTSTPPPKVETAKESPLEGTQIIKADDWSGDRNIPSTVAELRCRAGRKLTVMFGGKEYALNAAARADYTPAFFTLHDSPEGRSGLEDEEEAAAALCNGQKLLTKRISKSDLASSTRPASAIDIDTWSGSWSFTAPTAELRCHSGLMATAVVNGREYALNGPAQRSYPSVRPVWRENPDIPGTKVDIGDEIKAALALCE